MDLLPKVSETIREYALLTPGEAVVVGVSGGVDSVCLLHLLLRLAPELNIRLHVGHLEHGIRGQESVDDAHYVEELCAAWGVPCSIGRADVPSLAEERGLAIEEAARQARYRFLRDLARSFGAQTVAVAHNADDQVETVLMHFIRGSGLAGLRGMCPLSGLDELHLGDSPEPPSAERPIRLVRPLLYVQRSEIEAYAAEHGLQARFDRSNLDNTYFRNRLRHELIPHLEAYNPNIREVLRRTAEVVAGDYEVLRCVLQRTWPEVVRSESDRAIEFDLDALRRLPDGMIRSLLREGIHRLRWSLRDIGWVHVQAALRLVRQGNTGAAATLPGGLILRLGYHEAWLAEEGYVSPLAAGPLLEGSPLEVPLSGALELGGGWVLETRAIPSEALPVGWDSSLHPHTAYLDAEALPYPLRLRTRREGDRLRPLGMGGSQKVADLMINRKVPRGERDRVPILAGDGEVIWVIGLDVDERYAVTDKTHQVLVATVRRVDEQEISA